VLPGEVKAILFDIDGTLTHSDPVHFAMCVPGQLKARVR
jgi:FMN phosphatase YigB (HAD superfamily)